MKILRLVHGFIDSMYTYWDKKTIRRGRNLRFVPGLLNRRGGKVSYLEWGHVIGIFQTMINLNLKRPSGNFILDIGCGSGLLGIASEPFVQDGGRYTGIDVMKRNIEFSRKHYSEDHFHFIHHDVMNKAYTPSQPDEKKSWAIDDNSVDLVTALSVWTHLLEGSARFYFSELNRVLKPGARVLITFFLLDDIYDEFVDSRLDTDLPFHATDSDKWVFDVPIHQSSDWFTTKWADNPEDAIAITRKGLQSMLDESGLELLEVHQGSWKQVAGVYFQDILVLQKKMD